MLLTDSKPLDHFETVQTDLKCLDCFIPSDVRVGRYPHVRAYVLCILVSTRCTMHLLTNVPVIDCIFYMIGYRSRIACDLANRDVVDRLTCSQLHQDNSAPQVSNLSR